MYGDARFFLFFYRQSGVFHTGNDTVLQQIASFFMYPGFAQMLILKK